MTLSPTWVKNALARFQYWTVEWSRKRTLENAVANLEREKIRAILLAGPPKIEQD